MDKTIEQIRERHKKEIDAFMSTCPHPEISGWTPYMWAPGHISHYVKTCNRCEKVIEEDYPIVSNVVTKMSG